MGTTKQTRVRRTAQEKARLLKEADRSGVEATAKANGVAPSLLYNWRRGKGHVPKARRSRNGSAGGGWKSGLSLEDKRIMVEAAEASGRPLAEWAADKGVSVKDLYNWRARLRKTGREHGVLTNGHARNGKRTPIEERLAELEEQNAILRGIARVAQRHGLLGNLFDFMKED
jgi:transposase-like protein